MNSIILCEGKTDAVLLGYYIMKVCGYTYERKGIDTLTIKMEQDNENFCWYKNNGNYLAIWGVGGKDNFKSALENFLNVLQKSSEDKTYQQLILICDRDNNIDSTEILTAYSPQLTLIDQTVKTGKYVDSFGQLRNIELLALLIPQENLGALENVLLEAIKENDYDRKIAEKCEDFAGEMRIVADKYLSSERLVLKAKLSTVFAIISPEKVFSYIDEIIKTTVKWEEKAILRTLFRELIRIIS